MGYRTPEYRHLLVAECAIVHELENQNEDSNVPMLATALARVIDQKRVMRGQPAPKAQDLERKGKGRRSFSRPTGPVDPPTPQPVVVQPPPSEQHT